jgi:hypothetical protein
VTGNTVIDFQPASGRGSRFWFYGFGTMRWDYTGTRTWAIAAPCWSLVLLFSCLPATSTVRWIRRSRRAGRGGCVKCGYDLRATPDRCPECGAITIKTN